MEQKRSRRVGYLVPNILLNQQPVEISHDGMDLQEMLAADSTADLLLVVGTSLKTDGTYKLVKAMSQAIRSCGGAAVYVDKSKADRRLGSLIDMQIQVDIENWADCIRATSKEARVHSTSSDVPVTELFKF